MSPLRREGNEVTPVTNWDTWLDKTIGDAQRQGKFDDVPGKGRPLRFLENPYGADWDTAFSILKNADVAPYWIEIDKEVRAESAALRQLREQAARDSAAQLARRAKDQIARGHEPAAAPGTRRWWPFRRRRPAPRPSANTRLPSLAALEAARQRARTDYLQRAALLDKKIVEYHNSLPHDLWWLQRPRLTPAKAANEFDAACPPIGDDAWGEIIEEMTGQSDAHSLVNGDRQAGAA